MKLDEIAKIKIGIVVKREIEENGENSYELFSLKNYEENENYEQLKTTKDLTDKLAKKGDLLFRLLYPNKIIYVNKELEGLLIPSQYCIIRVQNEKMDPDVLKWYLESKRAKQDLNSKITGSIIKSMPVSNLKTLEIPDISIKEQSNMKELIKLWDKEKEISKQILEKKEKLYNFYLEEMLKKGESYARIRK